MSYFNEKLLLVSDSFNNINLFRLLNGDIIRYHFNNESEDYYESFISKGVLLEYDGYIDEKDTIYMIHQDKALNLVLTLLRKDKEIETIRLTEGPIPEVYYLNLIMDNETPHIFYLY